MLFLLYSYLSTTSKALNILHYTSFRVVVAFVVAFVVSLLLFPGFIRFMRNRAPQPIRSDGPDHNAKTGTPTMGGVVIVVSMLFAILLAANLNNVYVLTLMFVLASFGTLGFVDDFLKVVKENSKGVPGKVKLVVQVAISCLAIFSMNCQADAWFSGALVFPVFKNLALNIGVFYTLFRVVVITGSSNAINLTDGLDGLVTVPIIISAACLGVFAYITGSATYSEYLFFTTIKGTAEIVVPIAALIGACCGFLWFNAKPAQIFMGDVGSLSLGAFLGTVSTMIKCEIIFGIIGGLFVVEALSVILQVYYFRITGGKRIFRMAPIHHHFEKCGWSETQIVIRFWIIALLFAIAGLVTLKIR